ncbi:MAG: hypothetical protein Q9191_003800, partial [Dirinaria sp. TL-2023a]
MYGDHNYGQRESRAPSDTRVASDIRAPIIAATPPTDSSHRRTSSSRAENARTSTPRSNKTGPNPSKEKPSSQANGKRPVISSRAYSFETDNAQLSPTRSPRSRSNSDTANSAFPLNNVDYESDPAAVAQELSNLQALRRMSMDVNAASDPDLPSFSSSFGIPNAPPSGETDEDDKAGMFWVPARLHPELAPTEFQTFLNNKVESIKRRSGEFSLSPNGIQRDGSGGGLKRKKSMLSRQIDNSGGKGADGYRDGAELLERKKSLSGADALNTGISNLSDLEVLVNDSEAVMQKLSIDTGQHVTGGEILPGEDMPILPAAPTGGSLRRSTRTTYRKGSLKKGERLPYSKRAARAVEADGDEAAASPSVQTGNDSPLARVQTEPLPPTPKVVENFSRPGRPNRRVGSPQTANPTAQERASTFASRPDARDQPVPGLPPKHFVSQIASNGRSSISPQVFGVPQIVETPPPPDESRATPKQNYLPERVSSHEPPPSLPPQGHLPHVPSAARRQKPPTLVRPSQNDKGNQTLKEMAAHPSPLPGNSTRTDSLSFIPTLADDRKGDNKKVKDRKEKDTAAEGPRKSSWSWGSLLGNEEKEKEKRREEEAKKPKAKLTRPPDKTHDNTRLDLLQTTMEGSRGRESLVLDRGDLRLEEERKKESNRKTSGGDKKEKDSGLFSSLFGAKKKGEKEAVNKKHFSRGLSPEPPPRILKPDIDYMWTRFPILEERAIYRMAHIKLANPRRALHSQVLLSNFMYSYLAKVQQMHPQQIQSPAQKQAAQHKKADQPEEFYQYQKYQEQQAKLQQQEETQSNLQRPNPQMLQHDPDSLSDEPLFEQDQRDSGRYRPQSRASQHNGLQDFGNGHPNQGHGSHHYRTNAQHSSPYQFQETQFDEPGRSADEM